MSFRFGDFDTASEPGILATLKAWPGPALKPETVDLLDGAFYARTGLAPAALTFDVRLQAATPEAVHTLRDRLIAGCAPTSGLQALVPETGEGWRWWAACSAISEFTRGLWVRGLQCQLRADVSFIAPEGVAWANPDDTATGTTSATITRTRGNLPSYPTITVEGAFGGVTIAAAGQQVTVAVPVTAGQRLVLDYNAQEFAVWSGAVKVRHAAPGMDSFQRFTLPPSGATTITASPSSGTVSKVTVAANSRRV